MSQRKGKSSLVSSVVYVLAKLGYQRHKIAEVTKELEKTFGYKCQPRSFDNSLIKGKIDRKSLLPTIATQLPVDGGVKGVKKGGADQPNGGQD